MAMWFVYGPLLKNDSSKNILSLHYKIFVRSNCSTAAIFCMNRYRKPIKQFKTVLTVIQYSPDVASIKYIALLPIKVLERRLELVRLELPDPFVLLLLRY